MELVNPSDIVPSDFIIIRSHRAPKKTGCILEDEILADYGNETMFLSARVNVDDKSLNFSCDSGVEHPTLKLFKSLTEAGKYISSRTHPGTTESVVKFMMKDRHEIRITTVKDYIDEAIEIYRTEILPLTIRYIGLGHNDDEDFVEVYKQKD